MAKKKSPKKANAIPDSVPISVDELHFDPENPRLVETAPEKEFDDREIVRVLWKEMEVEEIALSIAAQGYFKHEPLFATRTGPKRYVVIEGNRRLAAVKLLLNADLRSAVNANQLPAISKTHIRELQTLPVIVTTREKIWKYVGFKHVNGARPWGAWSKAHYIAHVRKTYGAELEEISQMIGDRHDTVARLYRGLMVLRQADRSGAYSTEDKWHKRLYFSHLYTGLAYDGFQKFLGLRESSSYKPNPVPKNRKKNLGQLCVWLFGSKAGDEPPLIRSQNPDLRRLDEALQTKRGTDALTGGLPLQVAFEASQGDDRLFREYLLRAKLALQDAFGKVHTGYDGKSDLYESAEDIYRVSGRLLDAMEEIRNPNPKQKSRGRVQK